ncbi:hypothetical protein LU196_14420 [Pantoea sp. Mb-10]|uniref:hypothetical protein n=1 Tax=unclassified Pantoea TaxID=2630326 RepID=UPI001E2CC0B8|nr:MULTISPECIES: hypothetical protein [unclassified Pantoea]MCE0491239.1 hypothetical protein [Pantoea sp. Mb-10]MCE0502728.1 hypothetical protein [Pantoea sp. Pb-8]
MKRIERDFICLFNCFWYQDFPVSENDGPINRANWTIHIGLVVRQCAKLLGARAFFEQGNRTDAVIRYPDENKSLLTNIEWEWISAHKPRVNELEKLRIESGAPFFSTFISYSRKEHLTEVLDRAKAIWNGAEKPLILFIITFHVKGRDRIFEELQTYFFARNTVKKIRAQPALPWQVTRAKYNNSIDAD